MIGAENIRVYRSGGNFFCDPVRDKEVVDPPSGVILTGIEHIAPPSVSTGCIRIQKTEGICKTVLKHNGKTIPLLIGEACVAFVGGGIF